MTETRDPAKVTMKNAILAQCHKCLGYYTDGVQDCENVKCSLYPYMPYRKLEPDLTWTEYHPKRVGLVKFSSIPKKKLSEEQKAKLAAKLAECRAKKEQEQEPDSLISEPENHIVSLKEHSQKKMRNLLVEQLEKDGYIEEQPDTPRHPETDVWVPARIKMQPCHKPTFTLDPDEEEQP